MTRPRIGINCDLTVKDGVEIAKVNSAYVESVLSGGGLPVLLPPVPAELVAEALAGVDGLVLTGGRDYNPALYGEPPHPAAELLDPRRTEFDAALARAAIAASVPILGICGGAQLINIARGGSLVQHVPDRFGSAITHQWAGGQEPYHEVQVEAESALARIVGCGLVSVNSSHHQAIGRLGRGLRVVATASDGVVEAVEGDGAPFLIGVQWHPERMRSRDDQMALFRAVVAAAAAMMAP